MSYYYLVHLQYLGFRYHGWQKQTDFKSIHQTIEQSLTKFWGHDNFKMIGASRTDSMVSVNHGMFELISKSELKESDFVQDFNRFLPADIKILKLEKTTSQFNMIQDPKLKEYIYLFSFGEKMHPFAAPFMTHINEDLDIALMKEAAKCYEGIHHFKNFCFRPRETQNFDREILVSEILENDILKANFFPQNTFLFRIKAKSFMRYQVRMLMGGLFQVGMRKLSIEELIDSLCPNHFCNVMIAPASGLILNKLTID